MKKILFCLLGIILAIQIFPQQTFNWQVYSDQKEINAIAYFNGEIWAATSGGAFKYNTSTKEYTRFNKNDGLIGTAITSVTIDKYGKVWFGTVDGIINVYNPVSKKFTSIYEIYKSDKNPKAIIELRTSGDTIIVATDFGICVIDSKNLVFLDTYFKLGTLATNTKINSAIKSNLFFAGTQNGLAVQVTGTTNLSSPDSWTIVSAPVIPANAIKKIEKYKNLVIALTTSGLTSFNGTTWGAFLPEITGTIEDIYSTGDSLFLLYQNKIAVYNGSLNELYNDVSKFEKLINAPGYGIITASTLGIYSFPELKYLFPNGPISNQFPALSVDNEGTLWSASGTDVGGKGFYNLKKGFWENFNVSNSGISANSVYSIMANNNDIYLGYWGHGFSRLRNGVFTNFNASNTGLKGTKENTDYIVISGFDIDSKGNLWALNYASAANQNLSMLTTDSIWYHYSVPAENNQYMYQHFNLAIDNYDTKWYSVANPGFAGLYYFNENKTLSNTSDDKSGILTNINGLNDISIKAIAVDKRGDVWVGTPLGVNMITNTNTVFNTNPSFKITSIYALRQQSINCIAVDPLNNKWVGTNQGLLVVNSDGSNLLAAFNTLNSALLSDEIRSIAIDENSGTVYVGSDLGLVSFGTSSIKPEQSFSEIFIYPNPVIINGGEVKVTFDKLIRDTEIKILNISGVLVRELSTPGGRIGYWDGKDLNGNYVNSGVYIVIAFDKEGNNVATSKLAVIRK